MPTELYPLLCFSKNRFLPRRACKTVLWPYWSFEFEKPMRDIGSDNKALNGGQGRNRTTDTRIFN